MSRRKLGKSSLGRAMHYSVGAVIKKDGKILLLDRMNPPFGFAGPAGHLCEDESEYDALKREVKNETGLDVIGQRLLFQGEIPSSWCSRGDITTHYWYVFECDVTGEVALNSVVAKSIDWFPKEDVKKLGLEFMWEHWVKELELLK